VFVVDMEQLVWRAPLQHVRAMDALTPLYSLRRTALLNIPTVCGNQ
jgi:hypothetical protein